MEADSIWIPAPTNTIVLNDGERRGFGVNFLTYVSGKQGLLVAASFFAPSLFSFNTVTFTNDANFAWDMRALKDGFTAQDGTVYPSNSTRIAGKEYGFRAIAQDDTTNGYLYLSSRTDNRIYYVAKGLVDDAKEAENENTIGYPETDVLYKVKRNGPALTALGGGPLGGSTVNNFSTPTDKTTFPRLGDMISDCNENWGVPATDAGFLTCDAGAFATRLWVVGMNKSLYRVRLSSPTSIQGVDTATGVTGNYPLKLVRYAAAGRIYVANTEDHSIQVFDDDTLGLINTISD